MPTSLKDQVVVITGAAAGVGRATVREFARRGARIGLVARGIESLENAKKEVEALGGQAVVAPADVADSNQLAEAARKTEKTFGPIDVWVNVAMASVFSPVKEMRPEEYRRVTEVTYLGYVYGTQIALKTMLPRNRGVIVQVGSALAYRSIPLQSAYCAAKHAILGFTESLRTELLHDKSQVRVTMVELPAVNTPQFSWVKSRLPNKPQPVPPIFEPEVIARGIAYAATHKRRDVKIGFSTLKAVFAEKLAPSVADRYLATKGYSSQQTDQPEDPGRPDNLWKPIAEDRGARGAFSDRARSFSWELWLNERAPELLGIGLAAFGATALLACLDATRATRQVRGRIGNGELNSAR